jgi:succinylarginine dihydrolase
MREYNFDGLVGPTHNYGGLSSGNVASMTHGGLSSRPREAALQGVEKMRFVRGLGVGQGVLPPHPRPHLSFLRALGFSGRDEDVLARAGEGDAHLLRVASSAAAMWTANAATVGPSADTADGRLHLVPANLVTMPHRALEASTTTRVLRAIFADPHHFVVHDPLPALAQFSDEGAANHTRLFTKGHAAVHVFAWGRKGFTKHDETTTAPVRFPARQTREACEGIARAFALDPARALFAQQDPRGIDDGAFHTDVLAVGSGHLLLAHERAFTDLEGLTRELKGLLGDALRVVVAREDDLPTKDAVRAYPFNSQLLMLPDGGMCIIAPSEVNEVATARRFLDRVVDENVGVKSVHTFDLRQSMQNGGGPACLRLRVSMTDTEAKSLAARVLIDDELARELSAFVERHYRETLVPDDLRDPALWRECMTALDALTALLQLGSVYDFQRMGADRP